MVYTSNYHGSWHFSGGRGRTFRLNCYVQTDLPFAIGGLKAKPTEGSCNQTQPAHAESWFLMHHCGVSGRSQESPSGKSTKNAFLQSLSVTW